MFATRTLEFDRIVADVAALSLTPLGQVRLEAVKPVGDPQDVATLQRATTETVRFFEQNPQFPLRAGQGLTEALRGLTVEGRPLEPLALRTLAEFVDSVERARAGILAAAGSFPILETIVSRVARFTSEVEAVRQAIDVSGEVLDDASCGSGSVTRSSSSPAARTPRSTCRTMW
jgi:dsDNA-specific endonuclease/ATPase MutS2